MYRITVILTLISHLTSLLVKTEEAPNTAISETSELLNRFTDCSAAIRRELQPDLALVHRCYVLPLLVSRIHKKTLTPLCKEFARYTSLDTKLVAVATGYYCVRLACELATGKDFSSPFAAAKVTILFRRPVVKNFATEHAKFGFCFLVLVAPRKDVAALTGHACLAEMRDEEPLPEADELGIPDVKTYQAEMDQAVVDEQLSAMMKTRMQALMVEKKITKNTGKKLKKRKPLGWIAIGVIIAGVTVTMIFVGSISIYSANRG